MTTANEFEAFAATFGAEKRLTDAQRRDLDKARATKLRRAVISRARTMGCPVIGERVGRFKVWRDCRTGRFVSAPEAMRRRVAAGFPTLGAKA